jgi:hypothetical protein
MALAAALGPFFLLVPRFFPQKPRLGRLVRLAGVLGCAAGVAVVLVPSHKVGQTVHGILVFLAAGPCLTAALAATVGLLSAPGASRRIGYAALATLSFQMLIAERSGRALRDVAGRHYRRGVVIYLGAQTVAFGDDLLGQSRPDAVQLVELLRRGGVETDRPRPARGCRDSRAVTAARHGDLLAVRDPHRKVDRAEIGSPSRATRSTQRVGNTRALPSGSP